MGSLHPEHFATMSFLVLAVVAMVGGLASTRTFKVLRKLGAGEFGAVYEVQSTDAGKGVTMACKYMRRTIKQDENFQQEVSMLKHVGRHPNINQLLGSCQGTEGNYILLEMCHGGDVKELAKQGITEPQAAAYMLKLLETTQFMHATGVLHNDLKPDNVFLRKKGNLAPDNLVLGDLGLANTYEDCWDEAGTPGFMAPEILRDGVHSPKTDVFSLGVTLYFMVFGKLPFDFDLGERTTEYNYTRVKAKLKSRSAGLRNCILKMLAKSSKSRYTMEEALSDPWLLAASKLFDPASSSAPSTSLQAMTSGQPLHPSNSPHPPPASSSVPHAQPVVSRTKHTLPRPKAAITAAAPIRAVPFNALPSELLPPAQAKPIIAKGHANIPTEVPPNAPTNVCTRVSTSQSLPSPRKTRAAAKSTSLPSSKQASRGDDVPLKKQTTKAAKVPRKPSSMTPGPSFPTATGSSENINPNVLPSQASRIALAPKGPSKSTMTTSAQSVAAPLLSSTHPAAASTARPSRIPAPPVFDAERPATCDGTAVSKAPPPSPTVARDPHTRPGRASARAALPKPAANNAEPCITRTIRAVSKAPPPPPSAVASEAAQPVPVAARIPLHPSIRVSTRSTRPLGPSARPSAGLIDVSTGPANPRAGQQSSPSSSSSNDSSDDSSSDNDDEPGTSGGGAVAFARSPDLWSSPLPFTHFNPLFARPKTPPTHHDNGAPVNPLRYHFAHFANMMNQAIPGSKIGGKTFEQRKAAAGQKHARPEQMVPAAQLAGPAHAAKRRRVRFTEPPKHVASAQDTSEGTSEHHQHSLSTMHHRLDTTSATTGSTQHMKEAVTNPPDSAEQCFGQHIQDTFRRHSNADKRSTAATAAAGNNISSTQDQKEPTVEASEQEEQCNAACIQSITMGRKNIDKQVKAASTTAANSIRCTIDRKEPAGNAPDEEEQCNDASARNTTKGSQAADKQSLAVALEVVAASTAAGTTSDATATSSDFEYQSCNEAAHQTPNRSQTAYKQSSPAETVAATSSSRADDEEASCISRANAQQSCSAASAQETGVCSLSAKRAPIASRTRAASAVTASNPRRIVTTKAKAAASTAGSSLGIQRGPVAARTRAATASGAATTVSRGKRKVPVASASDGAEVHPDAKRVRAGTAQQECNDTQMQDAPSCGVSKSRKAGATKQSGKPAAKSRAAAKARDRQMQ